MKFYDPWYVTTIEILTITLGVLGIIIAILAILWFINN